MTASRDRIERVLRQVTAAVDADMSRRSELVEVNPCPKCGGEGRILKQVDWYGDGDPVPMFVPCECREALLLRSRQAQSGITKEFLRKTFDNFVIVGRPEAVIRAYRVARSYVSSWEEKGVLGVSMALLGASGSGKTHLCCAVANELMVKGVDVVYFPYTERVREFRQKRFDDAWQEEHRRRLKTCGLLMIDDLFKSAPDRYDFELIFEVLNERYFEGLPFIVSSELKPDELLELDAAIAGRIIERSKGFLAVLTEERGDWLLNYRLQP